MNPQKSPVYPQMSPVHLKKSTCKRFIRLTNTTQIRALYAKRDLCIRKRALYIRKRAPAKDSSTWQTQRLIHPAAATSCCLLPFSLALSLSLSPFLPAAPSLSLPLSLHLAHILSLCRPAPTSKSLPPLSPVLPPKNSYWDYSLCSSTWKKLAVALELNLGRDSFICVTWHIQMCAINHSGVWHDSFRWVTWLVQPCDMTHSFVRHGSFVRVTWLIHMCGMTHSYVWHI